MTIRRLAPLAIAAALAFVVWHIRANPATADANAPMPAERASIPVVVEPAANRAFRRVVSASGTLLSKNFSEVSPRASGVIDAVFVREGDEVKAGETRLFQMERQRLENAKIAAEQAVSMTENMLQERKAVLVKTEADAARVEKEYLRAQSLRKQSVITDQDYEAAESANLQAKAGILLATAQVATAEGDRKRAEASLAIAQKDLEDSVVLAPITGIVSHRFAEPGESGQTGTPIVRIDDPVNLEVVALLPAQYYEEVREGATRVDLRVNDRPVGEQNCVVDYRSPTIDGTLHTFKVKSDVAGDGGRGLVPGAMTTLSVVLQETEGVGVPTTALVEREGRWGVFVSNGGRARFVPLERTGLETDGWAEVKGDLKADDRVVIQGQFLLESGGSAVTEQTQGTSNR